jgi:RNA polymerase sigma-70 factor, ECF subfamily
MGLVDIPASALASGALDPVSLWAFSPTRSSRRVGSVSDAAWTPQAERAQPRSGRARPGQAPARSPSPVASVDRIAALVDRAARRDREAFADLYLIFHPKVFRLARFYLGAAAEDAVSETFVRAWAGLPGYRRMAAPFAAWLYGIARHVVADQRAALRREEPRPEIVGGTVEPDTDDRLNLNREIERLPHVQRYVIEGKFLVGLSNPELAAALRRSPGAINALQWRALRTLQRRLGER